MQISELTLRLLLLFFPGFICVLLLDTLTVRQRKSTGFFLIYAFVLGLASYLVLALAMQLGTCLPMIPDADPGELVFFRSLASPETALPWIEILGASVAAVVLAFGLTAADTYKLLHRFATKIRVGRKSGEPDVWNYMLNGPERDWVVVRVIADDLAYMGYAESWSYSIDDPAEILLSDVEVYRNSSGEMLYEVDAAYLAREANSMTIEIPEYDQAGSDQPTEGEDDGRG